MRDVYIAIMVAMSKGKGLHLTADEVIELSCDDAISQRALNSLETEEFQIAYDDPVGGWEKFDPSRERIAFNGAIRD